MLYMPKHRGFPSRLPSTDFQFTIRQPVKKGSPPKLFRRERYADRRPADRRADEGFMWALKEHFGEETFERGNLDAGRLNFVFGREVLPAQDPFDPESYEALLKLDLKLMERTFPDIFRPDWAPGQN